MTRRPLLLLTLVLMAGAAPPLLAAQAPETDRTPQSAGQTREQLERLLGEYGPALPRVLKLDPTLLTNDTYLQPYPALRQFLAGHPEIARSSAYYLSQYHTGMPGDRDEDSRQPRLPQERSYEMWNKVMDGFMVAFVFITLFGGVVWLIKTAIDHRRWTRMAKVQTEVHTKLMDRFASSEELLAYIQTPAGKRFLESAPIATDNPRSVGAPYGRILWSAQLGAVLAIAGIGVEIVASNATEEITQPVAAVGIFVIAIGLGFLVSAVLAYLISRRLGLLTSDRAVADVRG